MLRLFAIPYLARRFCTGQKVVVRCDGHMSGIAHPFSRNADGVERSHELGLFQELCEEAGVNGGDIHKGFFENLSRAHLCRRPVHNKEQQHLSQREQLDTDLGTDSSKDLCDFGIVDMERKIDDILGRAVCLRNADGTAKCDVTFFCQCPT